MSVELSGCYVLLITPFREDGAIDEESARRLIDHVIAHDVAGIIALGSVGEFYALTVDEQKRFMRVVAEHVAGRVPLGFGTSHSGTEIACDLTRYAEDVGGDFALVLGPYYGQRTPSIIYHHLRRVADATRMEIMLYDGGGGIEIPLDVMVRLVSECGNVNSAKISTPSSEKLAALVEQTGGACTCFVGVPSLTMLMLANGARGMSSGAPNVLPTEMATLMSSALSGDMTTARRIFAETLAPLANFISAPPLKLMLAWEGVIATPYVRMPLRPVGPAMRRELEATARAVGLELPYVERF